MFTLVNLVSVWGQCSHKNLQNTDLCDGVVEKQVAGVDAVAKIEICFMQLSKTHI